MITHISKVKTTDLKSATQQFFCFKCEYALGDVYLLTVLFIESAHVFGELNISVCN